MKKIIITSVIAFLCFSAMAQDRKVAVFEPAGNANNTVKEVVRELISSIVVNTEGYAVLERQLINKVLEEHRMQAGGLVDDNQIIEMGKLMGANFAFVTSITQLDRNFFISIKMIDVQTARIEKQNTTQTKEGMNDLVDVVQSLVSAMVGNMVMLQQQEAHLRRPELKQGELSFYFAGYDKVTKEEHGNILILVSLRETIIEVKKDKEGKSYETRSYKETIMGSGTLSEGFAVSFTDLKSDLYEVNIKAKGSTNIFSDNVKVGDANVKSYKIPLRSTMPKTDFEFTVRHSVNNKNVTTYEFIVK